MGCVGQVLRLPPGARGGGEGQALRPPRGARGRVLRPPGGACGGSGAEACSARPSARPVLPAADQVPLMEDLEQIFLRSWRESHLTETRQYQPAPQPCPPAPGPGPAAPVTSAQLPWLAGLAASSCNDSVHIIECTYSLAEGLSEMFRLLVEGKLAKTNYVVIICACRSAAIDSCIAVTGEALRRCALWPPRRSGWQERGLLAGRAWCGLGGRGIETPAQTRHRASRADAKQRGHESCCFPGKYQARVLSESLLTPAEYQEEVSYELVTGKVASLGAFFSTLCPGGLVRRQVPGMSRSDRSNEDTGVLGEPSPPDLQGVP